MPDPKWIKILFVCFALMFFLFYALEIDALARVGGGGSSGFRGSRSYSAPSRSYSPSSPYRSPDAPSTPTQQPAGGGFLRGMAGGIAGGILGSMLFRGLGFGGGWGGGGGGVGFFDIIIIAFILLLIYRFVKRRREQASPDTYYQSGAAGGTYAPPSFEPDYGSPQGEAMDTEAGLRHIRQMDPGLNEAGFTDQCIDTFFRVQGAWANRDMTSVKYLLTDEMFHTFQNDTDNLRTEKRINRLDNIAVRSTEIVEAWQESGRDYITVRFYANLLDYTIDEATGQVLSGSKTEPVKFEEYWTFTRSVGNNPWQLTALTQPE